MTCNPLQTPAPSTAAPAHHFKSLGRSFCYDPSRHACLVCPLGDTKPSPTIVPDEPAGHLRPPSACPVPSEQDIASCPVSTIDLVLTRLCNLACSYCAYYSDRPLDTGPSSVMSWEVARAALDLVLPMIRRGRPQRIRLTGAEPLMNRDLVQRVIDYVMPIYQQSGIRGHIFSLITNGTLLSDAMIEYLADKPVRVQISLDGPAECHDKHRRRRGADRGSHELVERAARAWLDRMGYLRVSAVWTPGGPTISERVAYFEQIGVTSASIYPVCLGCDAGDRFNLTADDLNQFLHELADYAQVLLNKFRMGQRPIFDPFTRVHSRLIARDLPVGCCDVVVGGQRTVDVDGKLYPCYGFVSQPQWELGDVWQGDRMDACLRFTEMRHAALVRRCEGCWAWPLCGGGDLCHIGDMSPTDGPRQGIVCDFIRRKAELAVGYIAELSDARPGESLGSRRGDL